MAKLCKIEEDTLGKFLRVDGIVCRPINYKNSRFHVGQEVAAYQHRGEPTAGVGKDASCKRGEYLETWNREWEYANVKTMAPITVRPLVGSRIIKAKQARKK